MKFFSNNFKSSRILAIVPGLVVLVIAGFLINKGIVSGQEDCSEAKLRGLGVAIINCGGDTSCSVNGVVTQAASSQIPEPHKSVIEQAASRFSVNPNLIAALFLTEQGNIWKPFEGPYASSPAGASGPFQFMPLTWGQYQEDGNNDGVRDIMNFHDAAHAAAKLAATGTNQSTPLGDINQPFQNNTMLRFAATYNWGGGNMQNAGITETSPITAAPTETQNYMRNIFTVINSDFTQSGHSAYGPPRLPDQQATGGGTSQPASTSGCVSTSTTGLVTDDPARARQIILSSSRVKWGNYGSATTQRQDVADCLTPNTLFAFATIAQNAGVEIPINALARDHDGCNSALNSHHNKGRAIDIGYYGNGAQGASRHKQEGDTLYKFLFDNREVLKVNQLIWQYPPSGYKCMQNSTVGECDEIYSASTMDQHYHHIHVSFNE